MSLSVGAPRLLSSGPVLVGVQVSWWETGPAHECTAGCHPVLLWLWAKKPTSGPVLVGVRAPGRKTRSTPENATG